MVEGENERELGWFCHIPSHAPSGDNDNKDKDTIRILLKGGMAGYLAEDPEKGPKADDSFSPPALRPHEGGKTNDAPGLGEVASGAGHRPNLKE
jgi:hypothetical protein